MESLREIQEKLKKEMPFKWRVQSFSKSKPQATCVAYIDSRDVQDMLDANCEWSDRYYEENGMLFCEITIYVGDKEFKRSDTGSESNVDKQKGHSSDAFKRAAVKFGVGRFLYSKKMQYLTANTKKEGGNYPFVVDNQGKQVWDITKHINGNKKESVKPSIKITNTTKTPTVIIPSEKLKACKNLTELQRVYKGLTRTEQIAMESLKDKFKLELPK